MKSKLKKILVTAGPTREMLDPVRYISNLSTGEMGYRFAEVARKKGYQVTLISGPTGLEKPRGVKMIPIDSVNDLKKACVSEFKHHDALVMSAAVCDFTPVKQTKKKIHRSSQITVRFKQTPDIIEGLAKKKGHRLAIGFCLETENWLARAKEKLKRKHLDGIVANYYTKTHNPFGNKRVSMALLSHVSPPLQLGRLTKRQISLRMLSWMESLSSFKN